MLKNIINCSLNRCRWAIWILVPNRVCFHFQLYILIFSLLCYWSLWSAGEVCDTYLLSCVLRFHEMAAWQASLSPRSTSLWSNAKVILSKRWMDWMQTQIFCRLIVVMSTLSLLHQKFAAVYLKMYKISCIYNFTGPYVDWLYCGLFSCRCDKPSCTCAGCWWCHRSWIDVRCEMWERDLPWEKPVVITLLITIR